MTSVSVLRAPSGLPRAALPACEAGDEDLVAFSGCGALLSRLSTGSLSSDADGANEIQVHLQRTQYGSLKGNHV